MTKREILTKASYWPMYAHELGGNTALLDLLARDDLLHATRCVSDNRKLYATTKRGRDYLKYRSQMSPLSLVWSWMRRITRRDKV